MLGGSSARKLGSILRQCNRLDDCVVTNSSSDLRWMFSSCPSSRLGGCSAGGVSLMKVAAILVFITGGALLLKTSKLTSSSLRYKTAL